MTPPRQSDRQRHEDAMAAARAAFSPTRSAGRCATGRSGPAIRAYLVALGEQGNIDARAVVEHYCDA